MICPDCGMKFDLEETRSDYNSFGKEDPMINYEDLPYQMCFDCAKRYVEAIYLNEMETHGYTLNQDGDLITYEEFESEMEQNPTGEYYS